MTKTARARYTFEFKQEEVRLMDNGQSIATVARIGSVALATDERDFGGDECQFLKLYGFFLPMHKTGRQKTA